MDKVANKALTRGMSIKLAQLPDSIAKELSFLDEDHSGGVSVDELRTAVRSFIESKKKNQFYKRMMIVGVCLFVFITLTQFGVMVAAINLAKDSKIKGSTLTTTSGATVLVGNSEFYIDANGNMVMGVKPSSSGARALQTTLPSFITTQSLKFNHRMCAANNMEIYAPGNSISINSGATLASGAAVPSISFSIALAARLSKKRVSIMTTISGCGIILKDCLVFTSGCEFTKIVGLSTEVAASYTKWQLTSTGLVDPASASFFDAFSPKPEDDSDINYAGLVRLLTGETTDAARMLQRVPTSGGTVSTSTPLSCSSWCKNNVDLTCACNSGSGCTAVQTPVVGTTCATG